MAVGPQPEPPVLLLLLSMNQWKEYSNLIRFWREGENLSTQFMSNQCQRRADAALLCFYSSHFHVFVFLPGLLWRSLKPQIAQNISILYLCLQPPAKTDTLLSLIVLKVAPPPNTGAKGSFPKMCVFSKVKSSKRSKERTFLSWLVHGQAGDIVLQGKRWYSEHNMRWDFETGPSKHLLWSRTSSEPSIVLQSNCNLHTAVRLYNDTI